MVRIPCAIACLLLITGNAVAQEPEKPRTKDEIEKLVREYLLEHPEIIVQSLQLYQTRQKVEARKRSQDAVKNHQTELLRDASTPVAGNRDGIPIVYFFDYRCGYCKQVEPLIQRLIAENPKVQVVFKEIPILGAQSLVGAKAAVAAHKQGAYFAFHKALMAASSPITDALIEEIAGKLNLDLGRLKSDMKSDETTAVLSRNQKLSESLEVEATPTFVIGTELVAGALSSEQLNSMIQQAETQRKLVNQ